MAYKSDLATTRQKFFLSSLPFPVQATYNWWVTYFVDRLLSVPYCSGMGFVLTYDAVLFAARNAELLVLDWPEDATVARWFAGTKISIVHDLRFVDWDWRVCNNETIIVHKHKYEHVPESGIMSSCFSVQ